MTRATGNGEAHTWEVMQTGIVAGARQLGSNASLAASSFPIILLFKPDFGLTEHVDASVREFFTQEAAVCQEIHPVIAANGFVIAS